MPNMGTNQMQVPLPLMSQQGQMDMSMQMMQKDQMIPMQGRKLKSHVCNFDGCTKSFDSRWALNRHLRTHTGDKPFTCPVQGCMKAFAEKSAMNRHMNSHSEERPYHCTYEGCGKSFKGKEYLEFHLRIHQEGNPYQCKYPGCGKNFQSPKSLRKHERLWHDTDGKNSNSEQQLRERLVKQQKKAKEKSAKQEATIKGLLDQNRQLKHELSELKKIMSKCTNCCVYINMKKSPTKKDEEDPIVEDEPDLDQYSSHHNMINQQLGVFTPFLPQSGSVLEPLPGTGNSESGNLLMNFQNSNHI